MTTFFAFRYASDPADGDEDEANFDLHAIRYTLQTIFGFSCLIFKNIFTHFSSENGENLGSNHRLSGAMFCTIRITFLFPKWRHIIYILLIIVADVDWTWCCSKLLIWALFSNSWVSSFTLSISTAFGFRPVNISVDSNMLKWMRSNEWILIEYFTLL